jgi:lipopolysaccharide transport system ATP-binding protein
VQAMVDPDILIVDEALAVGDEKFQRKCFQRLEELKSNGTSILFVSHSGPQILEFCDRAVLIEQGERVLFSDPAEVIKAYQQLIYAPADRQVELLAELKRMGDVDGPAAQQQRADVRWTIESRAPEVFDTGLVPDTRMVYPSLGAEIQSMHILTCDGRAVNVLHSGEEYQFVMSGAFTEDRSGVYVGIHMRSTSGLVITGQRHPEEGRYIEQVRAGQQFRVAFSFKMILIPGIYFFGGGVWSTSEPHCLHRILDAGMFRVLLDKPQKSFGYVDTSTHEPIAEFS